MKRTIQLLCLAAVLAALSLSSCKKSDPVKEKGNLLTASAWNPTAREWLTTDGRWVTAPSWASDIYARLTLFDNGTYTSGGSSGSSGKWQLSADGTQLVFIKVSGSSLTATIGSLTGSTLQLSTPLSGDYIIEGTAAKPVYTYCTSDRTTFSH